MNTIITFIKSCKKIGVKASIVKSILKLLGIYTQKEEIDTLYYFLNNFVDITEIGPASDEELRNLQLCDAAFLALLDKVFNKYQLKYWLDFGTLLGAYRHKGFVPWDDDTDISMPRKDYEKALKILPKELGKYGIVAKEDDGYPMSRIGIGYRHQKTGIWVDVYPIDEISINKKKEGYANILEKKLKKYQNYYRHNRNNSITSILNSKKFLLKDDCDANSKLYFVGQECFPSKIFVYEEDMIFPLKRMRFEGFMLSVPSDIDKFLTIEYGKNYMQFPHGGIEHHDLGRGALKTWAKRNGISMQNVYKYISEIKID